METEGADLRAETARTADKLKNALALMREVADVPEHARDPATKQTRRQRQREVETLSAKRDQLAKELKNLSRPGATGDADGPATSTGISPARS